MKPISLFGGGLKIHPLFVAVAVPAVLFGNAGLVMAFLLAVCIHECAHMLTAKAVGLSVESLYVLPFGCAAEISGMGGANAARAMLTAAAGPVAGIFTASILTLLPAGYADSYVLLFVWANLALAAVNLIPVLPLDGGRILFAVLKTVVSERAAWRALNWGGVIAGLGMCGFGAYMLAGGSMNPTWLVMGVFLFGYAAASLRNLPFASYRMSEEKRRRLARRGSADVKHIAVMRTATLREVLREMESSKLNIVTVLNDDFTIRATLSEVRIADAAAKKGADKKVGELT